MPTDKAVLLSAYLSTVTVSLGYNLYNSNKSFFKAKKESRRKLKYRKNLAAETKASLRCIYIEHFKLDLDIIINSLIPIRNVQYTLSCLKRLDKIEKIDMDYQNDIVKYSNDLEDYIRYRNITILKNVRDSLKYCPDELKQKMEENSGINEKATRLILCLNGLSYKKLVNEYEENEKKY